LLGRAGVVRVVAESEDGSRDPVEKVGRPRGAVVAARGDVAGADEHRIARLRRRRLGRDSV
jgi:hypothetical protein